MSDMLKRAGEFIWRNARLLDRHRFLFLFADGGREPLMSALRAYQNEDGGFGHALEPDIRCPDSQPIAVEKALHILRAAGPDAALLMRVCDYLETITTAESGVPRLLPSALGYPRAPWWETGPNPPAALNPTAGIVGLLYGLGVAHPWVERAAAFCWRHIEGGQVTDTHDLLTALRFLQHVTDRERAGRAFDSLTGAILAEAALDPQAGGYVKKPLDWAPTPDSLCRTLFSDEVIAAHLDALEARQQEDGGWPISWPAVSPAGEQEWRGFVTVEALRTLQAYGRV